MVPDHTSCKEIFDGAGLLIKSLHADVDTNFGRIMPCPDDNHLAELLGKLYDDRTLLDKVAQDCYDRVTDTCFNWDTIAEQFDDVFQEVIAKGEAEKPQIVKPKSRRNKKKS